MFFLVAGVAGVFVPGMQCSGVVLTGVGLLAEYWGFWRNDLTAERTGALQTEHPSMVEGQTEEIVAQKTILKVPTYDWVAGDMLGVMLIIAGIALHNPVAILGVAMLIGKNLFRGVSLRSGRLSAFHDQVWNAAAEPTVVRDYAVPDGHYVINLGGKHVGNGVGFGGTLHTCYHVTGGFNLKIGDAELSPVSMSISDDSVTYGGEWKLPSAEIPENGVVVVQVKTGDTGVRVYGVQTGVVVTSLGRAAYVGYDFDYGSSGSPVSGKPVALYGNGAYHKGRFVSWLAVGDHMETGQGAQDQSGPSETSTDPILVDRNVQRIIIDKHPGFGKTRRIVVAMVEEHIKAKKRILVLAPTRVVLGEIASVFLERGIPYDTAGGKYGKSFVVVMCHATFLNLIMSSGPARNVNGTIIMDEAHILDPRSIAARGVMEDHYTSGKGSVVLMTAM